MKKATIFVSLALFLAALTSCSKERPSESPYSGKSSIPETSEISSVQYLGYWCGHENPNAIVICNAYIEGYMSAAVLSATLTEKLFDGKKSLMLEILTACANSTHSENIGKALVEWLGEDNSRYQMPMGMGISHMLLNKYPCKPEA